ncbi:MAG TPA: prepilin-type N-terminal cleavage/methylation domain-containing protein [Gemmatimonadaceae bacterium]|nr:prepilin-type N-terminal cleavage/methylation domain-containing protein [Gemmatimonadaceae bacterium]
MRRSRRRSRRGFTLVEILIAMLIGIVIVTSATGFAVTTWQSLDGAQIREGVARNARFLGMSFDRDLQETGVDFGSMPEFGSLAVRNDTLSILSLPYDDGATSGAPVFSLAPRTVAPFVDPMGTCGIRCVDVKLPSGGTVELEKGDLAVMTVTGERRLILVNGVTPRADSTAVRFANVDSLVHRPATFADGLLLSTATSVQKMKMSVYWLEDSTLMRAERFNADGTLDGVVIAEHVLAFDVSLIFTDGDEHDEANPTDIDPTNDYDDISAVRIRVTLRADRIHSRVNGGAPLERAVEWRFSPRNLTYERNRTL